jgi:hypothetical protein
MMLLMLFADAGQTIYAHTCLKSNNVSFSINTPAACKEEQHHEVKSCCEKKKQKEAEDCTVGKKDCCSVSGKYVKASLGGENTVITPLSIPLQAVALSLFNLFTLQVEDASTAVQVYPSPPPLAYIHSQGFIQVFRI